MNVTYFPAEGDHKIFTDDFKLVAEGFDSRDSANEYIAKNTNKPVYDIFVMWNREFDWAYYGSHVGEEGLEEHKEKILFQGDGARVKKVKAVLKNN